MPTPHQQPDEDALRKMFAKAIVRRRAECALSQEQLAESTGLSTTYISLLERGRRNLTVLSAARIAAACGMNLSELVHLAEEQNLP
ncbi:helix-turn-helix domain-containing protein [Xylophilus rhododendri]|uniref:Helix-turn-helix domain-containing protein n=1 Tax=Xylophilus rhododendri TaxID=2697032 RepID=A0A857J0I3_9BURK|nr:helix-turn-helix transcriptional regulator [Xylophilus rhododendri]QHI96612.1 helix-turn-helix domain-containing protein [Xylophilus rhododendri]